MSALVAKPELSIETDEDLEAGACVVCRAPTNCGLAEINLISEEHDEEYCGDSVVNCQVLPSIHVCEGCVTDPRVQESLKQFQEDVFAALQKLFALKVN